MHFQCNFFPRTWINTSSVRWQHQQLSCPRMLEHLGTKSELTHWQKSCHCPQSSHRPRPDGAGRSSVARVLVSIQPTLQAAQSSGVTSDFSPFASQTKPLTPLDCSTAQVWTTLQVLLEQRHTGALSKAFWNHIVLPRLKSVGGFQSWLIWSSSHKGWDKQDIFMPLAFLWIHM